MQKDLLLSIQTWLKANGMAQSTFGRKAVNDGKLVRRLQEGGECLPSTEKKIRDFMTSYTFDT